MTVFGPLILIAVFVLPCCRNVDDMGDMGRRDRVAIAGESIRKLLKVTTRRKLNHSQVRETYESMRTLLSVANAKVDATSTNGMIDGCFRFDLNSSKLVSKSKDLKRAHDCLVQRLSPQC